MGFFDKILKTINIDSASELVSKLEQTFLNDSNTSSVTNSSNTTYSSSPNFSQESKSNGISQSKQKYKHAYNNLEQKMESIFSTEFSEFTVRKDISPEEFSAGPDARAYTYGLYDDFGRPRAFVMLMRNRNDYRCKSVLLAKDAAAMNNVPYMNFMPHLPNESSYITNRLRQNIFG